MNAYVIERRHPTVPSYWDGSAFTIDRERAIQFVRQRDAELLLRLRGGGAGGNREWNGCHVLPIANDWLEQFVGLSDPSFSRLLADSFAGHAREIAEHERSRAAVS
jgi:hypothetical protein